MDKSAYLLPVWETIETAWNNVKGAKATFWGAIGFYALLLVATIILFILFPSEQAPAVHAVIDIIARFMGFLLGLGLIYLGILRAYHAPITFRGVFRAFELRVMWRVIAIYFLQVLILLPAFIIVGLGFFITSLITQNTGYTTSISLNVLGTIIGLIGVCAVIYTAVRISYAMTFTLDKVIGPWEAIKASLKATRSNFWRIIALGLVQMGIFVLCVITLGIGFIWGIPFFLICHGTIYNRLITNNFSR